MSSLVGSLTCRPFSLSLTASANRGPVNERCGVEGRRAELGCNGRPIAQQHNAFKNSSNSFFFRPIALKLLSTVHMTRVTSEPRNSFIYFDMLSALQLGLMYKRLISTRGDQEVSQLGYN